MPGELTVVGRQVGDSFPVFNIATAHVGGTTRPGTTEAPSASSQVPTADSEAPAPPAETAADSEAPAPPAETVAMTLDAGRIDLQLETPEGYDLRVELLLVHSGHSGVGADLLATAATMIAEDPHHRSPQPGLTLPGLAGHVDGSITAVHGVVVVPFVWPQGVPQILEAEAPGGRHAQQGQTDDQVEFTHPGRLTVPAQLIMLTSEEFAILEAYGMEAAQQHIVENNKNLNDLWRD